MNHPRWTSVLTLGLVAVLASAGVEPARAAEPPASVLAAVQRYRQALVDVCDSGVTPELVRLHAETVKAVDDAKYGGGQGSNFWGPRSPVHAWLDCFQAGGDQR